MRPCGPEPEMRVRSMPRSPARRRASGVTWAPDAKRAGPKLRSGVRTSRHGSMAIGFDAAGVATCAATGGAARGALGAFGGGTAGAAFAGAADSPAPETIATTAPTGATCPAATRISESVPVEVAGTSIEVLSVSISNRFSPGFTASPTALNQTVILPSATVSPSCGIRMSMRLPDHRDVLGLLEFLHAFLRALAPQTRLLGAAERRRRVGNEATIEPDHAEIELLGDAHAARQVLGEEIGDETIFGVVGTLDGFVFALEGLDRGHRPEDLLVEHLRAIRHVGEHGRRIEEAGPVRHLAPGEDLGAFRHRVIDQLDDLVAAFLVDQRPDIDAVVEAVADLQRRHLGRELLGEFIVHLFVHVEAVRRRAGLAHVAHLRDHGAVDRGIDVGVVEHD